MSYVDDNLALREMVVYRARVHPVAYLWPLFLCMVWPAQLVGLLTTELAMTEKKLIGKRGLYWRETVNWFYAEIETVRIRQGFFGMVLDYGTVILIAGDGKKVKFNGIAEPFDLQQQLEEAIEKSILGRSLSRF